MASSLLLLLLSLLLPLPLPSPLLVLLLDNLHTLLFFFIYTVLACNRNAHTVPSLRSQTTMLQRQPFELISGCWSVPLKALQWDQAHLHLLGLPPYPLGPMTFPWRPSPHDVRLRHSFSQLVQGPHCRSSLPPCPQTRQVLPHGCYPFSNPTWLLAFRRFPSLDYKPKRWDWTMLWWSIY